MHTTEQSPSRPQHALFVAAMLATIALIALISPESSHAALKSMAGYEGAPDGATQFTGVSSYITNIRNGIIPLAIPIGTLGILAGGAMFLMGNQRAMSILGGVFAGVGLMLFSPNIVA